MPNEFDEYRARFAKQEEVKANAHERFKDPGARIRTFSGILLNWNGDFIGSDKATWERKTIPLDGIRLSGTGPSWNEILLIRCQRSVPAFKQLLKDEPSIREVFVQAKGYRADPVLLRHHTEGNLLTPIDGMHRIVGHILDGKDEIDAWVITNQDEFLPDCEPHVVYDLIRGFVRHANDEKGKEQLYHALMLLARTYGNVPELLRERFDPKKRNQPDDDPSGEIIRRVILDCSHS